MLGPAAFDSIVGNLARSRGRQVAAAGMPKAGPCSDALDAVLK
jgi:hypothetical protein